MGSKWERVKLALGLKLCVYVPEESPQQQQQQQHDDDESLSNVGLLLSPPPQTLNWDMNSSISVSSSRLSKSGSKSSKMLAVFEDYLKLLRMGMLRSSVLIFLAFVGLV
ncbi:hypothetical protein ACFE04_003294 [Oxalis oulophora]